LSSFWLHLWQYKPAIVETRRHILVNEEAIWDAVLTVSQPLDGALSTRNDDGITAVTKSWLTRRLRLEWPPAERAADAV
jgi:hypothetical protein